MNSPPDYVVQVKDLRIETLLHRVVAIMREHSILLPTDLTLMFKALITLEGLDYDPQFQLIERIRPFGERAMEERYRPTTVVRRGTP